MGSCDSGFMPKLARRLREQKTTKHWGIGVYDEQRDLGATRKSGGLIEEKSIYRESPGPTDPVP
jgi:hypothetical protein